MSMNTGTPSSGTQTREAASGVAQSAKQEATHVASSAADSAKQVASEATTQAKAVAQQAKEQVTSLLDQTRSEVRQTAQQKGEQAATGLRTFADQLRSLANGQPDQAGQLQRYVQDAQDRVSSLATRLENEGPQAVIGDVTRFARQRPVVFLAMAAGAGFALGRLVRAGAAASSDQSSGNGQSLYGSYGGAYADPYPPAYPVGVEEAVITGDVGVIGADPTWQAPTSHPTPTPGWTGESSGLGRTSGEF